MKFFFTSLFLLLAIVCFSQKNKKINIKDGTWLAELQLNEKDVLPFSLIIDKTISFTIKNGDEKIKLATPVFKDDSVYLTFPYFNSMLVFSVVNKEELNGYWVNYNKGKDYKIPCNAIKNEGPRFSQVKNTALVSNFNGKWQVEFEPNTSSSYPAIGLFSQSNNSNMVSGTFLTETGDYRYLEGNSVNDSLYLSCFDGSHAFLFKASLNNDSLIGKFYSGTHWSSEWIAKKNDSFELKNPEEITYLKENTKFEFSLKSLNNSTFSFPNENYKDKVVIIQIMGTWCPNCLDETVYFKSLFDKYHDSGLEVVSICYEVGKTFKEQVSSITRYKERLGVGFKFVVGGNASKNKASEDFNMLNDIISFPTSIFIGRDGEVKLVHTGFNGPGTGVYYDKFIKKTNSLIETLLAR